MTQKKNHKTYLSQHKTTKQKETNWYEKKKKKKSFIYKHPMQ